MHYSFKKMCFFVGVLAVFMIVFSCQTSQEGPVCKLQFGVSFPEEQSAEPLDGRVLLILSTDESREPRFQISDGLDTQLIFGIDVDGLSPGENALIDEGVLGYPINSLSNIPAGEYWVQGLLHIYETFHRADGHVVKLPMDRGEGQHWNRAPGNFFSTPQKVYIDPTKDQMVAVSLDQKIPPIADPPRNKIHQTRENPEQAPHRILGPAHVFGCPCASS